MRPAFAMPTVTGNLAGHRTQIEFFMYPGPPAPHIEQGPRPECKPKAAGNALDPILVKMDATRSDHVVVVAVAVGTDWNLVAIPVDIGCRNAARDTDPDSAEDAAERAELR